MTFFSERRSIDEQRDEQIHSNALDHKTLYVTVSVAAVVLLALLAVWRYLSWRKSTAPRHIILKESNVE